MEILGASPKPFTDLKVWKLLLGSAWVKGLRKIRNILDGRKIKLQPPVTCGWQLKPGKEPTTLKAEGRTTKKRKSIT